MKNLITCLVVCVLSGVTFADTWTVDDDGKADFDNIQAAVDAASDGDEIVVMPGIYTHQGNPNAGENLNEVVNMLGKALWLHSSKGEEVTIIDGEGARPGISCDSSETNKTIIEGFTITNGYANTVGGGMFSYNSSPTLKNCTFENNTANHGGGMFNYSGSPTLDGCTFKNNTAADKGGGMLNQSGTPTLTNCTFENNTAWTGGGINNYNNWENSATLNDCTFTNNTAAGTTSFGGGMTNHNSSPTLTDCTFTGNYSNWIGGGIYNYTSNPTLTDTTVCANTPTQVHGDWTDNGGNYIDDDCDTDSDGIYDSIDNCYLYNPDQADCNENGIGDVCDLYDATSSDCNQNDIPDVCDIADGTSDDINDNDIPDECEDSDGDGFPDDMDAFPDDPNEWADSDGDGMGDNEDIATLGACCVNSGCDLLAQVTCSSLGGTWLGAKGGGCANCPTICAADINGDSQVNVNDLILLIAAWGACP